MTPFRNELHSARRAYAAARYPGDLAADVLRRGEAGLANRLRRLRGGLLAMGAVAAAAAAVFVVARVPLGRLTATAPLPPPAVRPVAQRPTVLPSDRPLAAGLPLEWPAAAPVVPAVSLGAFPSRPMGVAPAVGRLTPPALLGARIVPALGGDKNNDPARANPAAGKPSTQESV